jgi:large subunit ribosomal protein L10
MDREQKAAQIEEMKASLSEADAIFAVDYRGISVPQAAELRDRLREVDATFRIVKNRLAKRAAESAGTEGLDELLEGPTALTFVNGDPVTAAKAISTFGRENDLLEFKGGFMEGVALDPEKFRTIARLPGVDVLHGQLAGLTASPLTGLVRGLASMLSGLAVALGEIQEKGLVQGEAEPQTDDAPADDAPAEDAAEEPEPEDAPPEDAPAEEPAAAEPEAEEAPAEEPAADEGEQETETEAEPKED